MAAPLPILDLDPYAPAVLAAPQAYYARLREAGPVAWIPALAACAVGSIDVVERVFKDPESFCSSRGVGLADFAREPPWRPPSLILEVDPPAHARTRAVMAAAMSPRVVRGLEARFAEGARAVVRDALDRGRCDGVTALAEAFPLGAFGDAVGLGPGDRSNLLRYGRMVFDALGPDNAIRRDAMRCAEEVLPWVADRCERSALSSGGIGASIYEAADTGAITEDEAALLVRSLLSAGVDTTVTAIASLLWCFATHPQAWQRLRDDRGLAPGAIDEVLRYASPIHTFCRTSTREVSLDVGAGVTIPADTKILCVLAVANRDPARWAQPDRFDIERPRAPHVAFGTGIHVCVGQHVARAELTALLEALLADVAAIELDGEPRWRPSNALQTLSALPLALTAA